MKRDQRQKLSTQMKWRAAKPVDNTDYVAPPGDTIHMVSTGSTLLDLSISGTRIRGGGIPVGILVEIFGPSSSGKTVLLCEIAGNVQKTGETMFNDPEGRLNKQFASLFGLKIKAENYKQPDTVPEIFQAVRDWKPGNGYHGIFADSLAALSTDLEMGKEGDKMGMRRPKEFSEELRKTCRILVRNNYLMVCSNQIRQDIHAAGYGPKDKAPGGKAVEFYSSLRLRTFVPEKINKEISWRGKKIKRAVGIRTIIEVNKSSVDIPYRRAPITIDFRYGIDDIRENLQFIKDYTKHNVYTLEGENLNQSMEKAIAIIEEQEWEDRLREEVIDLWEKIERSFETKRKPKQR